MTDKPKTDAEALELQRNEARGLLIVTESQLAARIAENTRLRRALRGGNALKDNAEMLEWFADRLVNVYHENPNIDYVRCARERASWIRAALMPLPDT